MYFRIMTVSNHLRYEIKILAQVKGISSIKGRVYLVSGFFTLTSLPTRVGKEVSTLLGKFDLKPSSLVPLTTVHVGLRNMCPLLG